MDWDIHPQCLCVAPRQLLPRDLLVRGPDMLPVLRRIAQQASATPLAAIRFNLWPGPATLGEQAIERIFELAPDEARHLLLNDIASPAPRFAQFAVDRLPGQSVVKADSTFANMLKKDPGPAIPLIAKFGTGALADAVREAYESEQWPCEEEKWSVSYFLRCGQWKGSKCWPGRWGKENIAVVSGFFLRR